MEVSQAGKVTLATAALAVFLSSGGCAGGGNGSSPPWPQLMSPSTDEGGILEGAPPPQADGAAGRSALQDAAGGAPSDAGGGLPSDAGLASQGTAPDGPSTPLPIPTLESVTEVCKLINDVDDSHPTANQTQTLANLEAADLGIPVASGTSLFVFFGDSWGNAGIWQQGQSFPDAVGYVTDSVSAVAADPSLLCKDLRFLTLAPSASVGPTVNSSVVADFAAAAMAPPSGQSVADYVHFPSGTSSDPFPKLPGTFEVPSGGFSYGGDVYLFYTTVDSPSNDVMEASYLAQWTAPTTTSLPDYNILYSVDERFDAAGPLYGDFINVSAETSGGYVYLFGTGAFRASAVHLARKSLASLATPGGFELYDPASSTWGTVRGAPIVDVPGYGETSVRYFAAIDRWMLLAEDLAGHNQIVARFAQAPEGPWSNAVVVSDMADPTFLAKYCCGSTCVGQQMIHCNDAGFYGTYLLPDLVVQADGSFTVAYTMSTWDPYDVVLMEATFAVSRPGG